MRPVFPIHFLSFTSFSLSVSLLSSRLSIIPSFCAPVFALTDSSDSDLELSTVRHQPEGLDQLQAQTKFTRKELQSLYRGFKNVGLNEHIYINHCSIVFYESNKYILLFLSL